MLRIINSVCSAKSNEEGLYLPIIRNMLAEHSLYSQTKSVHIFTDYELKIFNFIMDCYDKLGSIPTTELVEHHMNMEEGILGKAEKFTDHRSLKTYVKGVVKSKLVDNINTEIAHIGALGDSLSADGKDRIRSLLMAEQSISRHYSPRFDFRGHYADRLSRPAGMKFPVKQLNEKVGEMAEGEITTIAGYTSHYKSTLAMNVLYHNVLNYGFNGVIFTLETTKEHFWINLLSRHSIGNAGSYPCISATKVKRVLLTQNEIEAFDKVKEDWDEKRTGNLFVLDESDLENADPMEFMQILEEIDDLLEGNLHFFCVDYIQLLKYKNFAQNKTDAQAIGAYLEVFRNATQKFRKDTPFEKKLTGIILSQITRQGVQVADANEGEYPGPWVLSDSSELEKSSHRIVSTYTNDEMKANKEAYVQSLKSRDGLTSGTIIVHTTGDTYFYGDSDILDGGLDEYSMDTDIGELVDSEISGSGGFDADLGSIFGGGGHGLF